MNSLFEEIKLASAKADAINVKRDMSCVLIKTQSELGELADEVLIHTNQSYKSPGKDGVVGELVDTILCLVDLLHVYDPSIGEQELVAIAKLKGEKWINKNLEKRNSDQAAISQKIESIKFIRDRLDCGLLIAKRAVEAHPDDMDSALNHAAAARIETYVQPKITAAMVSKLYKEAHSSLTECKKALTICNGDMEQSLAWLNEGYHHPRSWI